MTFIKGISNSVSIFVNPESQTEETQQSQPQTNLGIANSADAFEAATANSYELLQPPQGNLPETQQSSTSEAVIDASLLFNSFDQAPLQLDARSQELQDRLNAIEARKMEIKSLRESKKEKALELVGMAQEIRSSINEDRALSQSMMASLGSLGVLGLIGGLPVPIIGGLLGGLGIFGGLSELDKKKMEQAAAELEKQAGQLDLENEQLKSELEDLEKQEDSLNHKKLELEQGFAEQEFKPSFMTTESSWQAQLPDETYLQNDNEPSTVEFSPDVQKLTNEE